mmetsp:Transcript_33860/g.80997  ORF Transcript_33860/g.80997 Transcript_33860/m.80997 type:complete len:745 (-) Transcript_33860:519-2753(-)
MEEINAWGSYEATTKNARSLGSTGVRRRQPTGVDRPSKDGHSVFFGTDDLAAIRPVEEVDEKKQEEALIKEKPPSPEFVEIRDLARDTFGVYFSSYDDEDVSEMKQKKKLGVLRSMNGTMPWFPALIKKRTGGPVKDCALFVEYCLRGIAQVYFQNNPLSGLLILTGMFVQSSRIAVQGLIAISAGNLTAVLMGFDHGLLSCGLFGYNSFLVGLALSTFYGPDTYYWAVVVGSIIMALFSSVLFVMLGKILAPYKTPPFTLPFNIATISFLLAMGNMNNVDMMPVRTPELPSYEVQELSGITARMFFAGAIRGVGQVFLANNIVAGCLVLAGILVCSRISALAAFLGSVIGTGTAVLMGSPSSAIENGMYGFNSSLTLTAMLMFYAPSLGSTIIGIVAAVITVFIQMALATSLEPSGLPFMTLPFCLAALCFVVIQGTLRTVISVPLGSMTTPEDHLKRIQKLSAGFDLLHGAISSASYSGRASSRRKSWVSSARSGTRRLTVVLDDYQDEIHGSDHGRNIFGRIKQMLKRSSGTSDSNNAMVDAREGKMNNAMSQQSFRMSFALRNKALYQDETKNAIHRMFLHIDADGNHEINKSQFEEFLKSVGLSDSLGLDFACQAFQLMDLDQSGDIDLDEFIAFSKISRHMPAIRRLIIKFFDFVDVNGDRSVELEELDQAREYLGLPAISEDDRASLMALSNDDGELEFDMITNFVTIFKLKAIIRDFQGKRKQGMPLDESIHSSIH